MSHTLGQKTKTYLILQQLQRNIRQLKAIVSLGQLLWENNDQILHFAYCWLKVPVLLQWRGTNETAGYSLHHWFSNLISLSSLYTCSRHVRRDNKWNWKEVHGSIQKIWHMECICSLPHVSDFGSKYSCWIELWLQKEAWKAYVSVFGLKWVYMGF